MEDTQEDIVYYRIFPDFDGSVTDVKALLEGLRAQCLTITYSAASEYIWQHELFNLRVCSSPSDCHFPSLQGKKAFVELENDIAGVEFSTPESFVPHLSGKVRFGDSLEDEWLVVFLLFEISRRILDVSVTVRDTDGEFLLIEAAYFIPRWIKPENSHNRVFVRQGHVHLVPFTPSTPFSAESGEAFSVKQALKVLLNGGLNTRASEKMMDAILHRMKQYPEKALENVHRARCTVPLPVAQILKYEPQMISLAVEAFYNRDYDGLKAVSRMEKFLPKNQDGTVEMVDVILRMSRAMYAQLLQQVFEAPRCYPMPSNLGGSRLKEAELGMKVACGFEIMYRERSAYDSETNSAEDGEPKSKICSSQAWSEKRSEVIPSNDPGWQTFKASLERNGYFKDLLEGSKGYRELLRAAVMQYRSSSMFASVSAAMRAPVKRTDELLSLPYSASDFAGAGSEEADSDEWLYNGEEELTAVMKERQKELDDYNVKLARKVAETKRDEEGSNQGGESGDFQVEEVVRSMQSFVNKMSSFEGAELPGSNDCNMADNDNDSVSVDMSKLWKELSTVFSPEDIASMFPTQPVPDDSDMSSDTDLDTDEQDTDDEFEATTTTAGTCKAHLVEIEDEGPRAIVSQEDAMFTEAYSDALENELQGSSMAKSFLRREDAKDIARGKEPVISDETSEVSKNPEKAEPPLDVKMTEEPEPDDDENDLVDVDANLVESLLRSFMFQQGMPGPATNLLGAMNVELPENADKRPLWKETVFWEGRMPPGNIDLYNSSSDEDA